MQMNKTQREAVRQLGFSGILCLDIYDFPKRMNYWLLENFDPVSRELQLQHGRRLRIEVSDVSVIFDFPRGAQKIQKTVRGQICQVMPKDELLSSILSDTIAEEWFKTNFMILVIISMIENSKDGHIYKNLMDCLDEIDNVSQYDWCEYVLRSLVNHTIKWKSNKTMSFTGFILFLLMMYVDRVEVYFREVPRYIPAFNRWNDTLLADRQSTELAAGDFRGGYPWPAYTRAEFIQENRERGCENQREQLAEERRHQDKWKGLAVEIPETETCSSNNLAIKRHREEADSDMPTEPAETPRVSKKKKAVIQTSTVSTRSRVTLKQTEHFTNFVNARETLRASECELHYWAMENKSDDESILNHAQAKLPEQKTPRRFFQTTNVSNYTVVAPSKEWND
ncbi:hypothetical protein C2S52_019885 [Perilla frutescens var. hirtella]|nr:hypothetical protein C2S52_019885 [Perilla frutescens var. hirtella]